MALRAGGLGISDPAAPADDPGDELDPLDELASIVGDLKAHLLWQEDSGATGVPRDPDLKERLKQNPLPSFSTPAQAPRENERNSIPSRERGTPEGPTTPASFKAPQLDGPEFSSNPAKRTTHITNKPPPAPVVKADRTHLATLGETLDEVRSKVVDCTQCELHATRKQTVFSRGTGSSGLCFVGEGPGADEDAQGEPFVGAAGQLLDKMIAAMGLDREEVYVCNIVKCRPPKNRRPTPLEMQSCTPYLQRQLELLNPQVIVALGGTAVTGLLGITDGITRVRGKFRLYDGRIAVMPTFHPAYLLRNASAKRQVWTDLRQVLAHMGREAPTQK